MSFLERLLPRDAQEALQLGRMLLKFGEEVAMTAIRIGRALHGEDYETAATIIETRRREQAAGKARLEAERWAAARGHIPPF